MVHVLFKWQGSKKGLVSCVWSGVHLQGVTYFATNLAQDTLRGWGARQGRASQPAKLLSAGSEGSREEIEEEKNLLNNWESIKN